jgi:hypothetical protein
VCSITLRANCWIISCQFLLHAFSSHIIVNVFDSYENSALQQQVQHCCLLPLQIIGNHDIVTDGELPKNMRMHLCYLLHLIWSQYVVQFQWNKFYNYVHSVCRYSLLSLLSVQVEACTTCKNSTKSTKPDVLVKVLALKLSHLTYHTTLYQLSFGITKASVASKAWLSHWQIHEHAIISSFLTLNTIPLASLAS